MEQPQLCFFFLLGVSVAVAQQIRVLPDIETTIELEFLNDGSTQWVNPYLVLSSTLNSKLFLVPTQTDIVEGHISSNEVLKVAVLIPPSIQIGLHKISVDLYHNENVFVSTFTRQVEVTCDDGIFCNGIERFVNGNCQNGFLPCDDGVVCTTDHCDNETGTCSWTLNGADCEPCTGTLCIPVCDGLECGPDGCDGRCGFCAAGFGCADGKCVVATSDGTCQAPIPLVPDNFSFNERMSVFGDTTGQLNQVVPTCNTLSDAPELVYVFSIPSGRTVGVEARVHDVGERSEDEYDTVLELRKTCSESESVISCSDDGTPPGFLGSRVNALLESGTYYLIVDGYSVDSFGEFELELNWVDNCMPFCDGSYCDSDLCGGSCGECNPNEICNDLGRCVVDPCVPDCEGKSCGTDSCGGNCGICEGNKLCVDDTFTCEEFIPCDHFLPECIGCTETEYCGSDCVCHGINDPRPDLVIDVEALKEVVYDTRMFTPTSCAVFEDCIRGTGMRDIIRLTIGSVNQGFANLIVPEPKTRPDLFSFSECHEHYHFEGFAIIDLLENERDEIVVKGSKVGFCVEDTSLFGTSPAFNCESEYDCGKQGIQAGWVDVYGSSLDCNWIDVTGIPAGDYRIRVSLNADRIIDESTFDNNVAIVPVKVLPKEEESPSTADDLQYDSFSYSRPDSFSSSTSRTTVETNSFSTRTSTKNSESSTSAGCQIICSALILISMLLL